MTRDYGAEPMLEATESRIRPSSETVIRFLDREAEITTRYGGGFVHSIDGLEGEHRRRSLAATGSSSSTGSSRRSARPRSSVRGGDRIWWDYRDWTDAMRTPAVVGSWPEPFAAGLDAGSRALAGPRRVPAAPTRPATRSPRRSATTGASRSAEPAERPAGPRDPGRAVGAGRATTRSPRCSSDGPATSGVFARFERSGGGFGCWRSTRRADVGREARRRTGLVAALRHGEEPPTWVVTGTDDDGVSRRPRAARRRAARATATPCRRRRDGDDRAARERERRMRSPLAYAPRPGPLGRARARSPRPSTSASLAVRRLRLLEPDRARAAPARPWSSPGCSPARARRCAAAARWAVDPRGAGDRGQRDRLPARRDDPASAVAELPVLGQIDVSAEALAEGGVLALRIAVVFCAFAVHSACVDPDRVLRLLRPIARHSALTATLITRLVPLAAADHARLREAQRAARAGGRAGRPRGARPAAGRRLARPRRRRRRDARAARLRARRARPRRPPAARSRHGWRFAAAGRRDRWRSGSAPRSRAPAASRPTRRSRSTPTRRRSRSPRRCRCSPRCRTSASTGGAGGVAERAPLVALRRASPTATRARAAPPLADIDLELGGGRVRRPRGPLGLGQVDPAARLLRAGPALPRRRGRRARSRSAGSTCATTGPAELGGLVGFVGQDPETQVVSATVRGELELPLELRGRARRPRGRGRSRR